MRKILIPKVVSLLLAVAAPVSTSMGYVIDKEDNAANILDTLPVENGKRFLEFRVCMSGPTRTLRDGKTSWLQALQEAADEWNAKMKDIRVKLVYTPDAVPSLSNGISEIFFDNQVKGFDELLVPVVLGGGLAAGFSTRELSESPEVQEKVYENDIIFNSRRNWDSFKGEGVYSEYDMKREALDCLGYALGLRHPDDYGQTVDAIMNAFYSKTIDILQEDDIVGIQQLLGKPPIDPTPTPAPPPSYVTVAHGRVRSVDKNTDKVTVWGNFYHHAPVKYVKFRIGGKDYVVYPSSPGFWVKKDIEVRDNRNLAVALMDQYDHSVASQVIHIPRSKK